MLIVLLLAGWVVSGQSSKFGSAGPAMDALKKGAPKWADAMKKNYKDKALAELKAQENYLRQEGHALKGTEKKGDNTYSKQKTYNSAMSKTLSKLSASIAEGTSDVETKLSKLEGDVDTGMTFAEDTSEEARANIEEDQEETVENGAVDTEKLAAKIQAASDKTAENIRVLVETYKDENSKLRSGVVQAVKDHKSYTAEQNAKLKELKGNLKESKKGTSAVEKAQASTFGKLKILNEKADYAVKAKAGSAAKATETLIKKKEVQFDKEVGNEDKEFLKELKAMEKDKSTSMKELFKAKTQMNAEFTSATKATQTQKDLNTKGSAKDMARQIKNLEKSEGELEKTAEKAQIVVAKNSKDNQILKAELTKASKDADQSTNAKEAAMAKFVTDAITSSSKEQFTKIKSDTEKVRASMDQKQAAIKKSFDEAAYRVKQDKSASEVLGTDLAKIIKRNTDDADKSDDKIGSLQKVVDQKKVESDNVIEKAKKEIKDKLEQNKEKIVDSSSTVRAKFDTLAKDGKSTAKVELDNSIQFSKQRELEVVAKIDNAVKSSEADTKMRLEQLKDKVTQDEQKAKSITASNLREKNKVEPISAQLKNANDVINEDLVIVKEAMKEALTKDKQSSSQKEQKFNEDTDERRDKVQSSVLKLEENVRANTEKQFTRLTESVGTLKQTAKVAFEENSKQVKSTSKLLQDANTYKTKVVADQERDKVALGDKLILTKQKMQSAQKIEPQKIDKALRKIEAVEKTKLSEAEKVLEKRQKMVIDQQRGEFAAVGGNIKSSIQSSITEAQLDAQATDAKFEDMKKKITDLGVKIITDEQGLDDKKAGLQNKLQESSTRAKSLKIAQKSDVDSEKEAVEKKVRVISDQVLKRVTVLNKDEHESREAMKTSTGGKLEAERVKVSSTTSNLAKLIEAKAKTTDKKVEMELEKAVATKQKAMKLVSDAAEKGKKLLTAVSKVEVEQQANDDKVQNSLNKEESDVTGQMDKEIGNLEGLTERLHATEESANTQVTTFDQRVDDELAQKAQQIKGAISATKSRFMKVLPQADKKTSSNGVSFIDAGADGPEELVNEFNRDTENAKHELQAAEDRMRQASGQQKTQMESFKHHLEQISVQRTKDVGKLHDGITEVKNQVADTMQNTIDAIRGMRNESYTAYASMEKQQKVLVRMLKNASQLTSNHDNQEIVAMGDKHDVLERDHTRLVDWQLNFKHYTIAWREEVDRKLRELSGEVGEGDAGMDHTQLQQEESMSDTMRSLKKGVEGEVVSAVGKEAGKIGNLVGFVNQDLDAVFQKSAKASEDANREIDEAQTGLDTAKTQSAKEMADIGEAQEHLVKKASEFTGAVDTAEAEISQNLLLPQQSASSRARAVDARLQALDTRLAGMSLLETNASSAVTVEAAVQALSLYHSALQKDNAALEASCRALEARVEEVQRRLQGIGVL